jgi:dihydroneopterin aldolase
MVKFLASISNINEAHQVKNCDIDIVDLKNIDDGALGYVGINTVLNISKILNTHILSVTMGNEKNPNTLQYIHNVEQVINQNIEFIKIGLFDKKLINEHKKFLEKIDCKNSKLICVLFADRTFDFNILKEIMDTRYHGVMIDTHYKNNNSTTELLTIEDIEYFIHITRKNKKFSGISGSLKFKHIEILKKLNPNFLGFRGVLCDTLSKRKLLKTNLVDRVSKEIKKNALINQGAA